MRNPIDVLKSLESKATQENYKFQRLYRNLYNPEFYLLAYQNIAKSTGSMTSGADGMTLDGMSMTRINRIIASLKDHSYQPNPARRHYIAKKNNPSKKRPLGIPSTDDKLVQEVVRMLLEAIYEPTFSEHSHGFRPGRSCHTALKEVQANFTGVNWVIEGDITACFDCFDHHVLIEILRRRIQDEHFISLMWKFLKAGYMEQWEYHKTYSGTPQGSGISPILANIYLNELDRHITEYKAAFDCGSSTKRKVNPEYERMRGTIKRAQRRNAKMWDELDEAELRDEIPHVRLLEKLHAAGDDEGNGKIRQLELELLRLKMRAVEHDDVRERVAVVFDERADFRDDGARLRERVDLREQQRHQQLQQQPQERQRKHPKPLQDSLPARRLR